MSGQNTGVMVIRFIDGTEERFEYARLAQDEVNLAARIEEAINAKHLLVELEGKLVIFPFHNIKAIEVSPVPAKIPRIALKKGRLR